MDALFATGPVRFSLTIYCSDLVSPPEDPSDASVQEVDSFSCSLDVRHEDLPIGTSRINGKQYRRVYYDIGMSTEDTQMQFSVWYNGEQQSSCAIDAEIEEAV